MRKLAVYEAPHFKALEIGSGMNGRCSGFATSPTLTFIHVRTKESEHVWKESGVGKAIPVLASLNIPRTLQFFAEVLGFETRHLTDFSFGMGARGQVEIHFWLCDEKHMAENTSCYVRVDDVYALHAELKSKIPALERVFQREWGMAKLYVFDPDGNLIKFGQPINDGQASSHA